MKPTLLVSSVYLTIWATRDPWPPLYLSLSPVVVKVQFKLCKVSDLELSLTVRATDCQQSIIIFTFFYWKVWSNLSFSKPIPPSYLCEIFVFCSALCVPGSLLLCSSWLLTRHISLSQPVNLSKSGLAFSPGNQDNKWVGHTSTHYNDTQRIVFLVFFYLTFLL